MKIYDVIIVGAGPGGIYTHYYAQTKGLTSLLIEGSNRLGGQPQSLYKEKTIINVPLFSKIKGIDLTKIFCQQINKKNVILNSLIVDITKKNNLFTLTSSTKQKFYAKYIIIAIGLGLFTFNQIEGKHFSTIHYIPKSIDFYKEKNVIIVGGGNSAIDLIKEFINKKNYKSLAIVHHKLNFNTNNKNIQTLFKNKCLKIYLNYQSTVIGKNKLKLINNVTKEEKLLNFDYLIVQCGCKIDLKSNEILNKFKLDKNNKIKVDYYGNTSINNAYAIGDIASYKDKPCLIAIAIFDGIKAIENICKKMHCKLCD